MNLDGFKATPIHKLSGDLNNNTFYIKRDDLIPLSFGGNKARKAYYFFREIEKGNYNCIVTYGSSVSNHLRVIANIAAAKDIPCDVILPGNISQTTCNGKLIGLFGANITACPASDVSGAISRRLERLKAEGKSPYFIPGGGHGNLGTMAYADAYEEIVQYEKETGMWFDYIFHASGTGTTQAGLICGQSVRRDPRCIVGISIARKKPYGKEAVLESVNCYLKHLGINHADTEVQFIDDYILDGYRSYDGRILQTIRDVLVKEGIPLDPTYTGKAYWGMKEYIMKHGIQNKNILFVHTGGTPLFFDFLMGLEQK